MLRGTPEADFFAAGDGNDVILVGDIPNMAAEDGLPPTVDPSRHFDTCIGAGGTDRAFTCERTIAI